MDVVGARFVLAPPRDDLYMEKPTPAQLTELSRLRTDARSNAKVAGALADFCRHALGWNYNQTFAFLQLRHPDMEVAEWDQLLAEADEEEALVE